MTELSLENKIKEESTQAIEAIRQKEEDEIKKLDEAYAADMESFRKQTETEAEARINQELSRLSNRAVLERRKFNLQMIQSFIEKIVDEVAKEIRNHPQYKQFLFKAVLEVTGNTSIDVEIHIKPEDMIWEKEILATVESADKNRKIVIKGDPGVHWGGCIIFDKNGGRIFTHTLERVYFRKSPLIRERVLKILTDHGYKV
jgi:flagellar biosynthesis/type III secretory pathway protein FliH